MITLHDMEDMLDEMAAGFPPDLFNDLNGGVVVVPEHKLHEKSVGKDLYTLAEYVTDPLLGRYIVFYFGSFVRVYGRHSSREFRDEVLKTLKHELRHHLEALAGEKDLDIEDAIDIAEYLHEKQSGGAI